MRIHHYPALRRLVTVVAMLSAGVVAGALLTPRVASAQAGGSNLSISPLTFELTANPGDQISNVVRVFNNGDTPMSVAMEIRDFTAAGERGEVALGTLENQSFSLTHWVKVSPETFVLEPRSFKVVDFNITVPPNAEPGGHYGTILASLTSTAESTGAALAQKIGSLLLLQVSGEIQEHMGVSSFVAPGFSEYGPVALTARFENTGSVHLKPRGFIVVKNMLGDEVARLDVPQSNVLPNSIRKLSVSVPDRWLWGRYDATLTAIYGTTNEPLSVSVSFWVFPWKVALGVGFAAIVVLLVLFRSRRRLKLAFKVLVTGDHR